MDFKMLEMTMKRKRHRYDYPPEYEKIRRKMCRKLERKADKQDEFLMTVYHCKKKRKK